VVMDSTRPWSAAFLDWWSKHLPEIEEPLKSPVRASQFLVHRSVITTTPIAAYKKIENWVRTEGVSDINMFPIMDFLWPQLFDR
jgi:hypothetical protein